MDLLYIEEQYFSRHHIKLNITCRILASKVFARRYPIDQLQTKQVPMATIGIAHAYPSELDGKMVLLKKNLKRHTYVIGSGEIRLEASSRLAEFKSTRRCYQHVKVINGLDYDSYKLQ